MNHTLRLSSLAIALAAAIGLAHAAGDSVSNPTMPSSTLGSAESSTTTGSNTDASSAMPSTAASSSTTGDSSTSLSSGSSTSDSSVASSTTEDSSKTGAVAQGVGTSTQADLSTPTTEQPPRAARN